MSKNVSTARRAHLPAILLLGWATLLSAQITITRNEVPDAIGDTFVLKYATEIAPVSVGEPGGPQTWTFDTSTYTGGITHLLVVDKNETPFGEVFPDANLCYRTGPLEGSAAYGFYVLADDALRGLGMGYVEPEPDVEVFDPAQLVCPLPHSFGNEWSVEYGWVDTMNMDDEIIVVTATWGRYHTDAWGTAILPFGSFPCLRTNSYDTTIVQTYMEGNLVSSDTSGYRTYRWDAENLGTIAFATGPENDTSQIFTQSDCYRVMVAAVTGIGEAQQGSLPRPVVQVEPNPFGRATRISLAAPSQEPVTFRVLDQSGRMVRTLAAHPAGDGTVSVIWDGKAEAGQAVNPGVYFVSGLGQTQKILFAP
ncbi:MAG: FlgD immunoglobulin-like domain containing protein [candidate division WOR-3 bacterium]